MFESIQQSEIGQSIKSSDFFGQVPGSGVRDSVVSKGVDIDMFGSVKSKNSDNSQSVASSIKSVPKLDNEKAVFKSQES